MPGYRNDPGGFSVLMYSMELMKNIVSPFAETESFTKLLTALESPLLSVTFATLFAALTEISEMTVKAFTDNNTDTTLNVGPPVVDKVFYPEYNLR